MERRKTSDFWAKLLFFFNIFSWILVLIILLMFHFAQPEQETFLDKLYKLKVRTYWDIQYLYYLIDAVIVGVIICLSGVVLGLFRARRKTDSKKSLIFMGLISLVMLGVALYVMKK